MLALDKEPFAAHKEPCLQQPGGIGAGVGGFGGFVKEIRMAKPVLVVGW
jgi:hypothetical protein